MKSGRGVAAGLVASTVVFLASACATTVQPPATTATGPHTPTQTSGTVYSVADGDTFTMTAADGTKIKGSAD